MLDSLLAYYPVGLMHISRLTRELAVDFQRGSFDPLRAWFLHRVLEKYYGPKKGLKLIPKSVFFFYGCTEPSTIHSYEDLHLRLKNVPIPLSRKSESYSTFASSTRRRDMQLSAASGPTGKPCASVWASLSWSRTKLPSSG